MEPTEINSLSRPYAIGKRVFLSRLFEILDSGDGTRDLLIAVSLLEEKGFFYFNNAFRKLVGNKIEKLLEQGWDLWFSNICTKESLMVKNMLRNFFSVPFDGKPITLRYHMYDGTKDLIYLRHEIVLHELENCTIAINYFYDVTQKERIENCLYVGNKRCSSDEIDGIKFITPREKEVLKLVADGYSSRQIANQLFISNHTAISHRKNLIEKFHVRNTAQLIKRASKIMEL